jgi:ATP-dependent Clp protease ATP-binding subunit ClpA
MVRHLLGYLSEDEARNVLQYYQKQLADFIHAQMQAHQWESATAYEVKVSKGFSELKQSAFTATGEERDYRQTVEDKSRIGQMVFGGFRRCLYAVQKFQSDTERKFAVILDRDAQKWFRPAKGQFQIYYQAGRDHLEYQPDFVAEASDIIYLCETKARNELETAEVVSKMTGVPLKKVGEDETRRLLNMEAELHGTVISQDEAIKAIARAVRKSRSGMKDPKRPIGSFIFAGPTGVGKTLLAKRLAQFMFGDENALVQIDMSEYQEKHNVSRLIGAPPGYVGYEEGGQLTEKIRRRPYSVVLLDEIEKAHPDVFNVLLQVLDDGRLTDGQGRTVDFTNVVLVMTSNLQGDPSSFFKPEFINRVDDIIRFRALTEDDLTHIVTIQLAHLRKRMADRRLNLTVTDAALAQLAHDGYDPSFGARPLKRVIQREIGDAAAMLILEGKAVEGDTITVDSVDGRLTVST